MPQILPVIVSIISVVFACLSFGFSVYFSSKNAKKTDVKDIEERVKTDTRLNMKLDEIGRNVKDTKDELSSLRDDIKSHNDRIIKVEESCKQAHHRLDGIDSRLNKVGVENE